MAPKQGKSPQNSPNSHFWALFHSLWAHLSLSIFFGRGQNAFAEVRFSDLGWSSLPIYIYHRSADAQGKIYICGVIYCGYIPHILRVCIYWAFAGLMGDFSDPVGASMGLKSGPIPPHLSLVNMPSSPSMFPESLSQVSSVSLI